VVQESTGRRNHNVGLLAEGNGLLHHIQTTQNQGTPEGNQGPECLEGLRNLRRKLSCGRQHKGEQGLGLVKESLKNRKGKRGCFTATGLCNTDDITVLQGKRDCLLLNGCGLLVSQLLTGVAEGVDNALPILSVPMIGSCSSPTRTKSWNDFWGGSPFPWPEALSMVTDSSSSLGEGTGSLGSGAGWGFDLVLGA
jgi:hypothetical protein